MKIEIEDLPPQSNNIARKNGSTSIRLIPETNLEMAQLERCLTVNVQFEKFRRWAHPDQVYYGFYGYYGSATPVSVPNDVTTGSTLTQNESSGPNLHRQC